MVACRRNCIEVKAIRVQLTVGCEKNFHQVQELHKPGCDTWLTAYQQRC